MSEFRGLYGFWAGAEARDAHSGTRPFQGYPGRMKIAAQGFAGATVVVLAVLAGPACQLRGGLKKEKAQDAAVQPKARSAD